MQKYKLFSKYKLFNTKNMEDNKNTTPEQQPLVAKTIRVEQQDLEQWNQVKRTLEENFGRKVSDTEVFGEVMTRYFMPQRANEAATRQIQERDTAIADLQQQLTAKCQELEQARADANSNAEATNAQQRPAAAGTPAAAIDMNYSVKEGLGVIKTASPRNSEAVLRKPLVWAGAHPAGGNGYRPY